MTIYALCDPETAEVRYVGQTNQAMDKRLYQHLADLVRGGDLKVAWLKDLRERGLAPRIVLLETVAADVADEAERRQIAAHRARGCALLNQSSGGSGRRRRASRRMLPWMCMLRLSEEDGAEVDRIAARESTPSATVCRRLIVERLEQVRRERKRGEGSHDLRAVR